MMRRILRLALCLSLVCAQNPWVRRKKKSDQPTQDDDAPIGKIRLDDEASSNSAKAAFDADNDFDRLNRLVSEFGSENMQMDTSWEGMSQMWEGLMDSPEMQQMLDDPAKLREAIADNPLLQAIPGVDKYVSQLLESETFQDPAKLKEAMRVGMNAFKSVGKEFTKELGTQIDQLVQNPQAFAQQISDTLENVMGDENLRKHIPGLDQVTPEQLAEHLKQTQDMFAGLLQADGKTEEEEVEVTPSGGHRRKRGAAATTTARA